MQASMIVGRGAMVTKQKASRAIIKKELAYQASKQTCTVDATTMQVRLVVSDQVVPPFAEGATLS